MKTSFAAIALVAASLALATSASAHRFDRSNTASAPTDQSLNTASTGQPAFGSRAGRIVLAAAGSATGGPSGGPSQNGG